MHEIEQLITLCSLRNGELDCEKFKQFLKQQQLKPKPKTAKSTVCPNLTFSVDRLRTTIEDHKNYFNFKLNEV